MTAMNITGMQRRTECLNQELVFKVVLWLWMEKSGKSRRLIEQQRRLANFADLRVKQQLQAEASSGESTAIEIGKYAG